MPSQKPVVVVAQYFDAALLALAAVALQLPFGFALVSGAMFMFAFSSARHDIACDGLYRVHHRRQLLRGTHAARLHFLDRPEVGADGDPGILAFYAISPLAHDLDPLFSEGDFEYLPNGGWGSPLTRLYAIA